MSLNPSPDSPSRPSSVPIHIGVIVVVGYLLLHMIRAQLVYGPYSFAIARILFLSLTLPCLTLGLHVPLRDLIGTYQLPKREDLRFCLVSLALVVVFRIALQIGANWMAPGSDRAELSAHRLLDECVVAPLNEEPVFRGLVLLCLLSAFSRWRWRLVLLSAAIFSACHSAHQPGTMMATMILGLVLAVFFLRTKSLSGSIVLHAVWNAGVFLPKL